jgi:hypothetical protein
VGGHARAPFFEVDVADLGAGLSPEQTARIRVNAGIEVVDLGREVREVILTSVEV